MAPASDRLAHLLARIDAFIATELAPLQAAHPEYFDHRREFARGQISMCNFRANRLACEAADRAIQVHGGIGYTSATSRALCSALATERPAGPSSDPRSSGLPAPSTARAACV